MWEVKRVGLDFLLSEIGWQLFYYGVSILWNGLFFCGAKLSSVAIFLLIRDAFFIVCQGPLERGIAGLSYVHVMKSKQVSRR